jgi:hypothetical protein
MKLGYIALSTAIAATVTACIPSLKSTFVDGSYPKKIEPMPERDLLLGVDAAILPTTLVGYERSREVGACLGSIAGDPGVTAAFWAYGGCVAGGGTLASCGSKLPFVGAAPTGSESVGGATEADAAQGGAPHPELAFPCSTPPRSRVDAMRLALSLTDAAEALYAYHLSDAGQSGVDAPLPPALADAFQATLRHAARVLSATPVASTDPTLPTLSLSGGAANGAFVSGYVYALLWLRERAHLYATPEQAAALDGYRFGSVFSSSVGSLVSLALELYFSSGTPSSAQKAALEQCVADGGGPVTALPGRLWQDCALARLQSDFVKNEWDLLCAQSGSIVRLTEPDFAGVLRFDPLEQDIVAPFFGTFEDVVAHNDFTRTTVTAELRQHVLVGIDERACLGQGMPTGQCLVEGVMSSLVEPVFVPPRPRVFSGLRGPDGESGHWLDGGIHSMNPTSRAAAYSLGKVLSVNTLRAHGVPLPKLEGALPLILETMNEFAMAQRDWELDYAELFRDHRRSRACALGELVGRSELCPPRNPHHLSPELDGEVLSVWVPDDIEPRRFVATGYTFDPLVMRGLFLWGKRELFESYHRVLSHLGWCGLEAMLDANVPCSVSGRSAALAADLAAHEKAVLDEIELLKQYGDDELWQEHTDERRGRVKKNLTVCE